MSAVHERIDADTDRRRDALIEVIVIDPRLVDVNSRRLFRFTPLLTEEERINSGAQLGIALGIGAAIGVAIDQVGVGIAVAVALWAALSTRSTT